MEAKRLAGLEPASVFGYFEEICSIPHGSRNTKQISDYLVSFAVAHGLKYIQDEANNVILFGEGTCGLEDHAPVILQGHMDMVCEKDADCAIDMAAEGLDVTHDGTFVFAKGTTLGGDDGIAIAYALALLADDSIPHPPLEVIITVDEEIGMLGADVIDLSMLKGKALINLDSEDEGIFTVSCAGGGAWGGLWPLHPSDCRRFSGRPLRCRDPQESGQCQQGYGRVHEPHPEFDAPVPDLSLRRL